jgi:cell division protein FtsB
MIRVSPYWKMSPAEAMASVRKHSLRILGVGLFALFLHDVFGPHGFVAMRRTQREIEEIRIQIGSLNEENKSLADEVNSLKTDPRAIERIAREDMGLTKPGEIIFKLPDANPVPQKSGK